MDLDEARAEVEEICRRLDGMPLAIELAAARTRSLTPTQLLARLDDRLRLLAGGRRAGAERHRTLRATVQWSYDLLAPGQKVLFERLAVFAGSFDLAAAEAVATGGELDTVDTDHLLGDLVERSMASVESSSSGRRFRLLETLRHFALEQLIAHGEHERVAWRHARWCRDEVASIGTLLRGPAPSRPRSICAGRRRSATRPNGSSTWSPPRTRTRSCSGSCGRVTAAQAGDHSAWEALVKRHGHEGHPVIRFNTAYLSEVGEESHAASPEAVTWLREHGEDHAADLVEVAGVASSLITLQRFADLESLAATMAQRHQHGARTLRYFALGMPPGAGRKRRPTPGAHVHARRARRPDHRLANRQVMSLYRSLGRGARC